MNLTILHFAVRCDEAISLAEMSARVAKAIGCHLDQGSYHKIPAARGNLLGMDVGLYEWGGVAGKTFRFEGEIEDTAFLDFTRGKSVDVVSLDISQAVADALTVGTMLAWRVPITEDFIAEKSYGDDVERRFSPAT